MKKSLMIFLGVATLCIGGMFFANKIVSATDKGEPKMTITAESQNKTVYEENIFEVNLVLNPGRIKFDSTNNLDKRILTQNYIKVTQNTFFEVVDATVDGKKMVVKNNTEVHLGDFEYNLDANQNNDLVCRNKNVVLKFKALKSGVYIGDNSLDKLIKFSYENIKGQNFIENVNGNINLTVDRLSYTKGHLLAGEKPVDNVKVGQYFDLNYKINPGTLKKAINERVDGEFEELPYGNERRVIYAIDKAAIDNVGANNEIARDSIKKSLEVLKTEKADTKTSLVVYGENAEIIKVDGKEIYSIDDLIAEIDKIEAKEISGNLGDAIRKAKYLANNNLEVDSSIVLVTDSNPNYYTQKSKSDTEMIIDRSNKDGISVEDKNIAQDYVNDVVNEIIIDEKDKTRWYGINYGIKDEQLLTNELIDKLDGVMANVNNPYYDDFAVINKKATEKIVIPGILEVTSKNSAVEINPLDAKQKIELTFDEIITDVSGQSNITFNPNPTEIDVIVRVKLSRLETLNLASNENIEAKFSVTHGAITQVMEFDGSKEDWTVAGEAPYVRTGFFNGKTEIKENIEITDGLEGVYELASKVLEPFDYADLAIENYFSFGAVIKPIGSNIKIQPKIKQDKNVSNVEEVGYKVYEYKEASRTFEICNTKPTEYEVGKIYLITIDYYINKELLGTEFEIGIDIDPQLASEPNKVNDFRGLNVNVVDKPEHF